MGGREEGSGGKGGMDGGGGLERFSNPVKPVTLQKNTTL